MNFIEKLIEMKRKSTQNYPQSIFHIKKKKKKRKKKKKKNKTHKMYPPTALRKNTLRGFEPDASGCLIL